MDRGKRSPDTRHGAAALALLLCLAGCGGHRNVQVSASNTPAPQSGGLSASVGNSGSALQALVVLGLLLGVYHLGGEDAVPAAPPDAARRIAEQDCTKPIDELAGNLRCR